GALPARQARVAIGPATAGDFRREIADLQHRRLLHWPAHETAGLAAALDQSGVGEFAKRLADRHARAIIMRGQLMLERDAMAGRPFAGKNARLDLGADALMQRRGLGHCASLSTAAA